MSTKEKESISLYISAFDLGSIAAFRFSNMENLPTSIYFTEIFTPGITVGFGFPKSPLSYHIGYQSAPFLNINDINELAITRTGCITAGLTVDIPFFTLK